MTRPRAAFFVMYEHGHFQPVRVLAADLARAGLGVHIFTDRRFRREVEAAGCVFEDLFAEHELEDADAESIPEPCRNVTFAGAHGREIAARVARLAPSLVVYDTFAVVGRVVALLLGLPHVNVSAHHNLHPAEALRGYRDDPRVALSPACLEAVEELRAIGVENASPFSFVDGVSPFLNLYSEPSAFLTEECRRALEPVAFYGSVPAAEASGRVDGSPSPFGPEPAGRRVFASFGTVVWRYWAREALAVLEATAAAVGRRPGMRALIALGGVDRGADAVRRLTRPNVAVTDYADQWRVLRDADVFVTHQGLNSTHEAIVSLVPMVSYPFFGDQPRLAEACRERGLAVPLGASPLAPVGEDDVAAALDEVEARREELLVRLAEARALELDLIAGRPSVVERICALIGAEPQHGVA